VRSVTATSAADVVIVHTLPADCARVLELAKVQCDHLVAYTTWEALSAPSKDIADALAPFHQVWVPSWRTAEAIDPVLVPRDPRDHGAVRVVPHAFCEETLPARRADHPHNTVPLEDRKFRFYYIGGWNGRKNPTGVIRAWAHAFRPDDEVELTLHCPGTPRDTLVGALAATGLAIKEMAPISWSPIAITDAEVLDIHRRGDCFVSASRGEAWNLPAFDAMLAGRHIICPAGQGSDEFLEDTSACRYAGQPAPAFADVHVGKSSTAEGGEGIAIRRVVAQGLTSRAVWIEPDLIALSQAMDDAHTLGTRTLTCNYDPVERFGYRAVGAILNTHLEELLS
jgi:glycosyltransferase involved in cell wall biosynthesis